MHEHDGNKAVLPCTSFPNCPNFASDLLPIGGYLLERLCQAVSAVLAHLHFWSGKTTIFFEGVK
jgi:hypothetical protein